MSRKLLPLFATVVATAMGVAGFSALPARAAAPVSMSASTASTPAAAPAAPSSVRVAATTHHALKLTWSTVKGATSYRVLRHPQGSTTYRTVATLHSAQRTTWTDRTTKSATVYLYRIQACAAPGCSPRSRWVSAVTTGSTKLTNATGVHTTATSGTTWAMSMAGYRDLLASPSSGSGVKVSSAARAQGRKPVSNRLRFVSSNPAVATVSSRGSVQALRFGTATITAIAHDGLTRTLTVVVRDYAHPTFTYSVITTPDIKTWFQAHSTQAGDLVDYLLTYLRSHQTLFGQIYLGASGEVKSDVPLSGTLKAEVTSMLTDSANPIVIEVYYGYINFWLFNLRTGNNIGGAGSVGYDAGNVYSSKYAPAPHWMWDDGVDLSFS